MDLYLFVSLGFVAGLLFYHVFFQRGPGAFEKTLWAGLREGKKVVIIFDDEALIFKINGSHLSITRAAADIIIEEPADDGDKKC